ncbi:unnamed protein product [Urochloa decumbens]|uniref:Uncharacterized protein n=1 Tax=Urochloa decumbens TaxID=240449 RepID=A0ABC9A6J5_9POAL
MAFDGSPVFDCGLASALEGDQATLSYLASSSHGGPRFEHNLVAPSSIQVGGSQIMGAPLDISSLVANIGMTPVGFEMPEGAIMASGYNTLGGFPLDVVEPPPPQTVNGDKPTSLKGMWTEEEDRVLKDMVMQLGERRWSVIAQSLPGRIGKQCRERWINHLRPGIKQNEIWTLEDDKLLIGAHKHFGNSWSAIARFLPGWSENAIKNHWNATKRSLKAKRRLKKKKSEQVPPGQLSILEEYIRSVTPASEFATPPPPSLPSQSLAYSGVISPEFVQAPAPEMEMNFNATIPVGPASPHLPGMINQGMPQQLPDLNIRFDPQEMCRMSYQMCAPAPAARPHLVSEYPQQASFNWFPPAEYLAGLSPELATGAGGPSYYAGGSSSNAGASGYYSEAGSGYYSEAGAGYYSEAGPTNASGSGGEPVGEADDIAELASREFMMPSSDDEVTLDFIRFE